MPNIMTCGPDEHPCKGCGLPVSKSLEMCNLCEKGISCEYPHKCMTCGVVLHHDQDICECGNEF